MSVEITAKIICDNCGATVFGKAETRSTYAKSTYWSAMDEAKNRNWMLLSRGQYRMRKHYCQICANENPVNKNSITPQLLGMKE